MKIEMTATAMTHSTRAIGPAAAAVSSRGASQRSPWLRRALIFAAITAPALFWAGERRVPAGAAEGATLEGAVVAVEPRSSFRVGSFNIHAGKGTDRRQDIGRIAGCLERMDLVALNEVAGSRPWQDWNQSQQLGDSLKCQWLFAPTESRWWHGSFGNGLLTRLPALYWQRIPFHLAGSHTHRNMVLTAIEINGARVNVLLTHLDSRDLDRRQNQLRAAGELFLSLAEPAILLGDLNSNADDEQLRKILDSPGVVDAVTAGGVPADAKRIDWILTRGLRAIDAGALDNGASDHPFYWAELELAK